MKQHAYGNQPLVPPFDSLVIASHNTELNVWFSTLKLADAAMLDLDQQAEQPLSPEQKWTAGIFLTIVLGLFTAEVFWNYEPIKLSALLVVLFWFPLLALHEAGHAIMAHQLGWYVSRVVIGFGRPFHSFQIGSTIVEWRVWLLSGFVLSLPTNLHMPRTKQALIYFAGPGVELLVAGLVYFSFGADRLLVRSEDYFIIAAQSLMLAAIAGAVMNLIPAKVRSGGEFIDNDGLGIIRSFTRPREDFYDLAEAPFDGTERDHYEDPSDWWKRR